MTVSGPRYQAIDAAIVMTYLDTYPTVMHNVAVELGYHNPPIGVPLESAPSEEEWFERLLEQYWLADQPGGKKSGARDARIWLKAAFPTVQSSDLLVQLIQARVAETREAVAT